MNEPSASAARPEIARTDSSGTLPRNDRDDKGKGQPAVPLQRTTRYKEKFLTMKERYEVVTAAHEKYERELALANEKMKKLQNECNLLLDAVDIAVPGQPTLIHYLQMDSVDPPYALLGNLDNPAAPPPVPVVAEPLPPPPTLSRSASQNSVPQTNGTNGHA